MPLSKQRNRDRMKQIRLHAKIVTPVVQPEPIVAPWDWVQEHTYYSENIELDADGNPIPDLT